MGDVYSPHHINNARRASSPPRQIHNARNAGVYHPLSIHGEGVADRPGVRSGGWRGEVRQRSPLGANATKNARDTSLYRAWARGVQRLTYILRSPEPRVAIK